MKKFFTLIAAVLMAANVNAQTPLTFGGQGDGGSWSWGYNQDWESGSVSLIVTSGYGRFDVCKGVTPTAGQKLVVDIASVEGEHQISWKEGGTEQYSGALKVGENTITFGDGGAISDVNLLGPATAANQLISVNSVKLDGVQTKYEAKWNYGVLSSKWTSTGAWAEMYLNKVNKYTDLYILIKTNSPIINYVAGDPGEGFQLKVKRTDSTEDYLPLPGGSNQAIVACGANVKEISVQSMAANQVLDIAGIFANEGEITGVENVIVSPSATSSKVYNLNGQLVDDSYKGIVVKNGKKMIKK